MSVSYAQLLCSDREKLERLARFLKLRPEAEWEHQMLAALVKWRIERLKARAWRV
jgi:hypothetical protein